MTLALPSRRSAAVAPTLRERILAAPWDVSSLAGLFGLLSLVALTYHDYGIANDELVQHIYGRRLLNFYLSGFVDRSAFDYINLYLYGGLFDLLAAGIEKLLPFDPWEMRHLLCGFVGVLGIAGAGALARHFAGPRAGFLAGAVLAVCGVWYGGMFNNTKDVPFGTAMVWAVYFLACLVERLPAPPWRLLLGFGAAAGCALGLRVGALLLLAYAGLALLSWALVDGRGRGAGERARRFAGAVLRLLPAAGLAYALMALFWPWSVQQPGNPLRALSEFSQFHIIIDTILAGREMRMYDVPRSYLPIYLAIKLPLLLWAGVALYGGLLLASYRAARNDPAASPSPLRPGFVVLLLAALFPIAYAVATRPPLYDGLRHFMFVLPPLAAVAGIGLHRGIDWTLARLPLGSGVPTGAIGLAIGLQVVTLAELHPYEYVYYNGLVGGLPGAAGDYVTDYWANSVPAATEALARYLIRQNGGRPPARVYNVGVCAERLTFEHAAPPFLRWVKNWGKADYYISPTHMECDDVMPGRAIAVVRRLGVTLAVVKDLRQRPLP